MQKISFHRIMYALLCVFNVMYGLSLIYFLITNSNRHILPAFPFSLDSLTKYIPNLILIVLSLVAHINAYVIWKQKGLTQKPRFSATLTFVPVLWFQLIFAELFGTNFLLLFAIVIIALIILFLRNVSLKAAGVLSFITIALTGLIFVSNFEENYCWNKGTQANPHGLMTTATKQDAEDLHGYGISEGQLISIGFRVHMLCHNTFQFSKAIKETLLNK